MDALSTIIRLTRGTSYPRDEQGARDLVDAYYRFSLEEGKFLAMHALKQEDRDTCSVLLLNLALLVPGALSDVYPEIIDRDLFLWGPHFYNAPQEICEELAKRLKCETDQRKCAQWVEALAWAGSDFAQKKLAEAVHENQEYRDLIPVAGWELTADGRRRDLFFHESYELILDETTGSDFLSTSCRWCREPLLVPFDLDLSGQRFEDFGITRKTLRIAVCGKCIAFQPIYQKINASGEPGWHPFNQKPEYPLDEYDVCEFVEILINGRLVIGNQAGSPRELVAWLPTVSNRLGGLPGWVQSPEYPLCVNCKKRMKFLAQFDYGCVCYAFICQDCGVAASTTQFD